MFENSLKEALFATSVLVHKRLEEVLPIDKDSTLMKAMRYSAMSNGKRIRPFLTMTSAQIFGISPVISLNSATALEIIHTYSLIHDDLPAMDDDDFRRGRLSCHKMFNEATAILSGDALLTLAFELLSDPKSHQDPNVRCEIINVVAKAAGYRGTAGGQMLDLESSNRQISKEELAKLYRLKTGELFISACEIGAIIGRASEEERKALRYFANDLGLAFQIKDDILDHCGISIGKTDIDENIHKKPKDNISIVDVVGMDSALEQLKMLRDQAIAHLRIFGEKAILLKDLAEFVINRQN